MKRRAIRAAALLAAGTAGCQAAFTAAGHGPAGIVLAVTAVLATAITVLGPEWFWLRALRQPGRDLRWLIKNKQPAGDIEQLGKLLQSCQEKVLDVRAASQATRADAPGGER
jgi:hypothetical protein